MANDALVHLQLGFTRTTESYTATTLSFQVCPQTGESWKHIAVLCQFYLCLSCSGLGTHRKDVEDEAGAVKNLHLKHLLNVAHLLGREFIIENHHSDRLRHILLYRQLILQQLLQFLLFAAFGSLHLIILCIIISVASFCACYNASLIGISQCYLLFPIGIHFILFVLDELSDFLQFAATQIGDAAGAIHFLGITLDDLGSCSLCQELKFIQVFLGLFLVLLWSDKPHQHSGFHLRLCYYEFFHSNMF